VTPHALAAVIRDAMDAQADPHAGEYVARDCDLTACAVDADLDLVALARVVLAALSQPVQAAGA